MGVFKKGKAAIVRNDAERAWKEGHKVFVSRFEVAFSQGYTSGVATDMAEMIEAVEDVGWVMHNFQYTGGVRSAFGEKELAIGLFRRE